MAYASTSITPEIYEKLETEFLSNPRQFSTYQLQQLNKYRQKQNLGRPYRVTTTGDVKYKKGITVYGEAPTYDPQTQQIQETGYRIDSDAVPFSERVAQQRRSTIQQQKFDEGRLAFAGYTPVATSTSGDTLYTKYQPQSGKENFNQTLQTSKPTFLERIRIKSDVSTSKIKNEQLRQVARVPFGIASGVSEVGIGAYKLVTSPVETTKGLYSSARDFFTNYQVRQEFIANVRNEPGFFTGRVAGQYLGAKGLSVAGETGLNKVKNAYVGFGAKEISILDVTTPEIVSGKQLMPMAKSTGEIFSKFKATKTSRDTYLVTSASPQKISGNVVEIGKKSAKALEDPGIYVTPKGEASLYFTRVGKQNIPSEYSFNPITNLREIRGIPTVTEFEVVDITRYPRSVLNQEKGFISVANYQKSVLSKEAVVVIPKRSELAFGTAVYRGELTSSELQGVIPQGSRFAYKTPTSLIGRAKGFDKYFTYNGRRVAYREVEVLRQGESRGLRNAGLDSEISPSKIRAEASYLRYKTKSPYKYGISTFSSKSSKYDSELSSLSSFKSSLKSVLSNFSKGSSSKSSIFSLSTNFYSNYGSSISGISRHTSGASSTSGASYIYGGAKTRTPLVPKYGLGDRKNKGKLFARPVVTKRTVKQYTPSVTALFQQRNIFKPKRTKRSTGIGVISGLGVRY